MLIEIHILQNYAPSNLNRDDTGSPKDCIFGGVRRARISSQCLKRSVRVSEIMREALAKSGFGTRSRRFPECVRQYVLEQLTGKCSPEEASLIGEVCKVKCTGLANKDGKESEDGEMPQSMFFTDLDVKTIGDYFLKKFVLDPQTNGLKGAAHDIVKSLKDAKMKEVQKSVELKSWRPITPDIALFGRMTTSDAFHDVEASVQVAHAISVNKMDHEFDFFTAVDDLQKRGDKESAGADMMGDVEFTSGCFYKYFSIDCEGFEQNMLGPSPTSSSRDEVKEIEREIIPALVEAFAIAAPTGKQNSFAAHQLPAAILVEVKDQKVPISYANAFLKPVTPSRDKDLSEAAIDALKTYKETIEKKYGCRRRESLWLTTKNMKIDNTTECESFHILIEKMKEYL